MKVQITCEDFPMLLLNMMVADLVKRLDNIDVQTGGESTVFVTFKSDDIVKIQECCIIVDQYRFGHGIEPEKLLV